MKGDHMLRIVMVGLAMVVASSAGAQLPGFGKPGGGSAGGVTAEQLVKDYVLADKDVLAAQSKLLSAVGLKDHAAKVDAVANSLNEGATKDGLSDSTKIKGEASQLLEEGYKTTSGKLDADGKARFAEGLGFLGRGITKYVAMKSTISGYKPSITSLGSAAGAASYVVQTAPSQMANLSATLNHAIDFAKTNDIPLPADATSAMKLKF